MPRKTTLALAASSLFVAVAVNYAAPPGDPITGEVHVNGTTLGDQRTASDLNGDGVIDQDADVVARDAAGDYVVVWSGNGSGDSDGIFAQRFGRNGVAAGGEIRVNTTTAQVQKNPAVAMDPGGGFVVTWESNLQDGGGLGIFAQRFSAAGAAVGAEFRVNTFTAGDQSQPALAVSADGAFVIAWRSIGQDGSGQGVYAQRYDNTGAAAGGEFRVNTTTLNSQSAPTVAMQVNGDFAIAWESSGQESAALGLGVYLQRYGATGLTFGAETHVNTATAGDQSGADIAALPAGGYVVAWQSADASGKGIFMQRFDGSGLPVGVETAVNTSTAGDQIFADVATDARGRMIVAWQGPDAAGNGIYAQRYDAAGTALGSEFAVNTTTTDDQSGASTAADADGDFVVAWQSNLQEGALQGVGVYARRFAGPEDVDLSLAAIDSPDPAQVGGAISYTLTVANNHAVSTPSGVAAIDGSVGNATSVVLTETLDPSVTYNNSTGSDAGWTCTNVTTNVTCSFANALPAAATSTVKLNVTAPVSASAVTLNSAGAVSADQFDSTPANNSATEPTAVCVQANAGTIGFSAASFSGTEGPGARATITVSRTGGNCGAVIVKYSTSDGTAKDGVPSSEQKDYQAASGTLTFEQGVTSQSFDVNLTDDALDEANETVNLALSLPVGSERGALDPTLRNAVLTIVDDDAAPGVALTADSTSITEAGGIATLTATLSTVSAQDVTVNLGFSGTAAGTDYSTSAASISIPAGQLTGTATVNAIDDDRNENSETVIVDITTVVNGTETGVQRQTVTIVDNDPLPALSFTASSANPAESSGTLTVGLKLTPISGRTVTVNVADLPDTALGGGVDYTLDTDPVTAGVQTGPVTFAADGSGVATVAVILNNDTLDENAETFSLALSSPSNAMLAAPSTEAFTIIDDDSQPTVNFNVNSASVSESGGDQVVTVTANLSTASGLPVSVPFTVSGSAANPQDHNAVDGTINIVAGATSGSTSYTVFNDTLNDAPGETVILTMGTPTNAAPGANKVHTTTITDNDAAPTINFTAAAQSVSEAVAGGTATITAQLSGPSGRTVSVPFNVGGTATNGSDYTITASPATIAPGATQTTLTVNIVNDVTDEPNETVIATLTAPADGSTTLGATTQHTLSITNDDSVPQVSFSASGQSVIENVMLGTATVGVQLSRAYSEDVTVPFSVVTMLTNADPEDYTVTTGSPLIIPAGETTGTIVLSITDDQRDENDQTVTLALGTPVNATVISPSQHALTILDDDAPPALNFITSARSVAEGGPVSVTVRPSVVSEKPISAPFTVGGSASGGGVDHDAVAGSISIAPGAAGDSYSFNIVADTLHETAETVVLTLGTPSNASVGGVGTETVTITDDDAAPDVSLSLAGSPLAENGGSATVTATLAAVSGVDAVVDLTFNGTATEGADYSHSATQIVIPAGSTSGSVTLASIDDNSVEGDETIVTGIGSATDANPVAPSSVTATITDDDVAPPDVTLSLAGSPFAENGGVATVQATLSSVSNQAVTVNLGFAGNARAADYSRSATSIVVPAGALTGSITLTGINDTLNEVNETVIVSITSVVNGTQSTAQSVTAVITDDDPPPSVTLALAGSPFAENGGTATITASLSTASGRNVVVNIGFGGTATVGSDYTRTGTAAGPSGVSITILAGATSGTVTLTGVDDALNEDNELVAAQVNSVVNATIGTPQRVTATITDDDPLPSVTLGTSASAIAENGGVATVTATLSTVSGRSIVVNVGFGGTATIGTDYSRTGTVTGPNNGSITIAPGAMSGSIALTGVDDVLDETNESIAVQIVSVGNATFTAPQKVITTITDDDPPPSVTLALSGSPFAENGGVATVTATLSQVSAKQVTVNLGFTGTATNGSDYAPSASTIVIPAGSTTGSITLTGIDDAIVDPAETVKVDVTTVVNGTESGTQQVIATIADND